ncbi:MAG: hypothetical protein ACE5LU_29670, partial [Anaerolineae bacterium]
MTMTRCQGNTRPRRGDERGAALIATLLVIIVLTVLGIVMLGLSITDTQNTMRIDEDLQALYAADAGVENVVNQLWAAYVGEDCSTCTYPKDPGQIGTLNSYVDFLDR